MDIMFMDSFKSPVKHSYFSDVAAVGLWKVVGIFNTINMRFMVKHVTYAK